MFKFIYFALAIFIVKWTFASGFNLDEDGEECGYNNLEIVCSNLNSDDLLQDLLYNSSLQFESLVIHNSIFDALWSVVCEMTFLKRLNVSVNDISTIPQGCFKNFTNLQVLDLSYNKIETLNSHSFEGLRNILTLILSRNFIHTIDNDVFLDDYSFKSVGTIDLSYNKLTSLEPWPLMIKSINPVWVDLKANRLEYFPNSLNFTFDCHTNYINVIDLKGNNIQHLSDIFVHWTDNITKVLCPYDYIPNIQALQNMYECDCVDYSLRKLAQDSFVTNTFLDDKVCQAVSERMLVHPVNNLTCKIDDFCPKNCSCYQRPHTGSLVVDCRNARYKNIPSVLPSLVSLTAFYESSLKYDLLFSKNLITGITLSDYIINHTQSLDLSQNFINEIPFHVWNQLVSFENFINLQGNNLVSLPKELEKVKVQSKHINLKDNLWSCDCENSWMQRWLSSQADVFSSNVLVCSNPEWHRSKNMLYVDFCYVPPINLAVILVPVIFGVFLTFGLLVYIWYRYRVDIYYIFGVKLFEVDLVDGEELTNDVFLLCSDDEFSRGDNEEGEHCLRKFALMGELVHWLEKDQHFTTIIGLRDFDPALPLLDNFLDAIETSKRIILIVSEHFLNDNNCLQGVNLTFGNVQDKRRIIVVLCNGLKTDHPKMPIELKLYFQIYTYLEVNRTLEKTGKDWKRLIYALPKKRILNEEDLIENQV